MLTEETVTIGLTDRLDEGEERKGENNFDVIDRSLGRKILN